MIIQINVYGPRTQFAPGFPDLFGGIKDPYRPEKRLPVVKGTYEERYADLFALLRKQREIAGDDLALALNVTRDSVYAKLRILFNARHVDYTFKCKPGGKVRYKHWRLVEEGEAWTGGMS